MKIAQQATIQAIRRGAIAAYPTESFYALGADATNPKAVAKIYQLKLREKGKPIALIAGNLKQVRKFFYLSAAELQLAKKHWPGAVTILLRPKPGIAAAALVGPTAPNPSYDRRGGLARGRRPLVGVRIPEHAQARALALSVGAPITATSANTSGQPPTKSARQVKRDFPGILVIPGRCGRQWRPSTVVEIIKHQIKIIRPGAVHV